MIKIIFKLVLISLLTSSATVWANTSPENVCKRIVRGRKVEDKSEGHKKAITFVNEIIDHINGDEVEGLQKKFHTRFKFKNINIEKIYRKLELQYGKPYKANLYRMWNLTQNNKAKAMASCSGDSLEVMTNFGYESQYAAWIDLRGKYELAKIFVNIVPNKGSYSIGTWHTQQWSLGGRDFESYADEASKMKEKLASWAYFDMATKLIDSKRFIKTKDLDVLISRRDQIMSAKEWENQIKPFFEGFEVHHLATFPGSDGVGILARIKFELDKAGSNLINNCKAISEKLLKQSWYKNHIGGLRCSYYSKGEDPRVEGRLGGVYVSSKS